jgi:hypothetical protein
MVNSQERGGWVRGERGTSALSYQGLVVFHLCIESWRADGSIPPGRTAGVKPAARLILGIASGLSRKIMRRS